MKPTSQKKTVLIVVSLVIIACSFAVFLRLFTVGELWYQMFAAILGVIITAVITMILLQGQSNKEADLQKDTKVFEEKLRIYQDYLHTLCEVIKNQSLSKEKKINLEFQTSYVAMHCDSKHIAAVSSAVKRLIKNCCSDEESENLGPKSKSGSPEVLLKELFCVVEAFRKDLYGDDSQQFEQEHRDRILADFSDAYRNARSNDCIAKQGQQRITVDLNVLSNSLTNVASIETVSENKSNEKDSEQQANSVHTEDTSLWDETSLKWEEEGWHVEGMSEQYDGFKMTNTNGNPGVINVGLRKGHYYIQAAYGTYSDFSKPLKWEKGGRRNWGEWWQYLAEPYYNIPEGKFVETFKSDKNLQRYIKDNVEQLKDIINRYHRTMTWKNEVGSYDNWKMGIWYWDTLVCELSSEEKGTPYMDIIEDGNSGKVLIQFANRKNDKELLNSVLKRIECQDKEINEDCYVDLETVSSTDASIVSERVKYWIDKIDGRLTNKT